MLSATCCFGKSGYIQPVLILFPVPPTSNPIVQPYREDPQPQNTAAHVSDWFFIIGGNYGIVLL